MNIKAYLTEIAVQNGLAAEFLQLPDCELDLAKIKVIMINEVVPRNPDDWFYSEAHDPENRRTAFAIFELAGVSVKSMHDILDFGIYITTALKTPKVGYAAAPEVIRAQLPLLEAELALFPNLKVIMLMGGVAIQAVNMIEKAKTKKTVCPSSAAGRRQYLLKHDAFYWNGVRVFPSYIMTGKNLLIEPFKRDTIAEDIRRMIKVIL